ncbi:MAG TPA: hypothetical protein PKC28_11870 [Bdellovibrionales bacterium]|nr:hypothetical protein [Bdellovibrionales bacterium]
MLWQKLLQVFLGGALTGGSFAVVPPSFTPNRLPTVDEILSYECGQTVASILELYDQVGPTFFGRGLVFASIENTQGSPLLMVSGGAGLYSVPLSAVGVNRLRFLLPTNRALVPRAFYLSYMHGGPSRSRVFELSDGRAPHGKDDLDFIEVLPARAEALLPHWDYAIFQTAENTIAALTGKKLAGEQIQHRSKEGCEHLDRRSPSLAKSLTHSLNGIDLLAFGSPRVASRAPASGR